MTIVASQSALRIESSAVPLARYAYIVDYPECRFWGVSNSGESSSVCREILTKPERDRIAHYLAEAQNEIEQVTGYRLAPTWTTNEERSYSVPVRTTWGKVIAGGIRGETTIQAGAAVSHVADPATVGPIATTVTDESEIYIYHPGTDVEINPSVVTISGGFVTIQIPRCRMVLQSVYAAGGTIDYTNTVNFEQTVDVKRIYNDTSENATLVWLHGKTCTCSSSCCGCTNDTEAGCIVVRSSEVGAVDVRQATYSSGSWSTSSFSCGRCPDNVLLNYYSGLTPITPQVEDTIVRLAHSKMPDPPCGCSVLQDLWKRDRNVPAVLTAERLNCPFGINDGAWVAWRFANALRLVRGGTL